MEQQFTDVEKRFVLAEAIKASSIHVEALQQLLFQYNVAPDWEQMLLPNGRNIAQCKLALQSIQLPHSQMSTPQPYPQAFLSPAPQGYSSTSGSKRQSIHLQAQAGPEQKRPRKSNAETPTARDLLPKPIGPNGGSPMSTVSSSPAATTSQKKRGRPSKADVERKQREAIERGDIIPPAPASQSQAGPSGRDESSSQTPKMILPAPRPDEHRTYGNPQSALTPGHGPQMVLEHGSPASMGAEPPGKKRKPRPPPKPKATKPGESQFSIITGVSQPGQGENAYAPLSAETSQAGPVAGPSEAGNIPSAPATNQEPAPPTTQPKSDEK